MARRWVAYGITLVAVAAVALPGFTDRDSFPLSNYPMFSSDRGRVAAFDTAVGIAPDGEVERLSPRRISGSYEVIHAASTVSKAIRAGDAPRLCREIAARAVGDGLAHVEVVTETYDTVRWFEGDEVPVARTLHARCEVGS
jgi:hypothetical protein